MDLLNQLRYCCEYWFDLGMVIAIMIGIVDWLGL